LTPLERIALRTALSKAKPLNFSEFIESPDFCGAYIGETQLSPAILDIAQASDGLIPTHLSDEALEQVFRCSRLDFASGVKPKTVVVGAGRRGGKTSHLLAPKAVHAAWTTPLPDLKPGERARAAIIAPIKDQAVAAFNYCKGIVESSPILSRAIQKINSEEILLRRPDGHLVEIVVGAANRGGLVGRSRTLVFAGLDEAQFFRSDNYQVNDRDIFGGVMGTLRFQPGAQCWIVSTPWVEGEGLMEDFIEKHWGSPGGDTLVAARISSYQLRGILDDGSLRLDTDDDESYDREILSIPLPRGTSTFFDGVALQEALKVLPPVKPPEDLGAGADFAFERDCSALVVAARYPGGIFAPIIVEERTPKRSDINSATKTTRELVRVAVGQGCTDILADAHCRPFVREHFELEGANFLDAPAGGDKKFETYAALKRVIADRRFVLGHLEEAVGKYVVAQLRAIVAKPKEGGGFKIISPRTKSSLDSARDGEGGSHGDVVSALVLAMWAVGSNRREAEWARPKLGVTVPFTDMGGSSRGGPRGSGMSLDYLRRNSAGASLRRR
jgi:hypothetical protein